MEIKDNKIPPSINQTTTVILSIVVATVILGGIGLLGYWLDPGPNNEGENIAKSTETWPDVPPTFTPTSSPTPESTPLPTATTTPTPTPAPTATPTPIIIGWKELGYLTTAEFTSVTVTDFTRERAFMPDERILQRFRRKS
jgi:hypothetical protein